MQHTGPVIREARKALGMSLRELAERSEVDFSTISRIERGVTNPSARTVKALTDALGAAIAERGAA
jgi:transcriptional regulator with XRE-family HTH domain